MTTIRIPLPYTKPPLSLNQRLHHHQKARITSELRNAVHVQARAMRLPTGLPHVSVSLHYRPRNKGIRDEDNLVATLKPACDALAAGTPRYPGYGLVADDTPDQMTKSMPVIHEPIKGEPGSLWLLIEWKDPA